MGDLSFQSGLQFSLDSGQVVCVLDGGLELAGRFGGFVFLLRVDQDRDQGGGFVHEFVFGVLGVGFTETLAQLQVLLVVRDDPRNILFGFDELGVQDHTFSA